MPTTLRMRSVLTFVVIFLLAGVPAFAQTETATLSGVVQDPKGGVVPDVEVTATRIETGTVATTKTNGAGIYFFTGLVPGHYHLMVRKPGFKEIAIKQFELQVQDKLEQNFSLEIGSVSETVTVEAGGLVINTTDASVSTVIDHHFVENLPLNGRSFNTLLQLTPGVVIAQIPTGGTSAPGQFSIAGQRTDANNFTVDGVSANFGVGVSANLGQSGTGSAQAFSALGGTSSLISVEALQEFRIETSSFAPEFGRSPGGQVILTTRSGTNDFHGGIYEYFRNDVMDANDWFANQAGKSRASERHNDFGGFVGGPIWRDRTFFFLSYEGARLRLPQTRVQQVPSEYARSTASADVAPFLDAYPLPDNRTATTGVYTSPFTGTYSNSATLDAGSMRIDHTFDSRFSIFARFNDAPSDTLGRVTGLSLNTLSKITANTKTLTVGANMLFRAGMFNSVRGNYSTQTANQIDTLDSFGGGVPLNLNLLLGSLPSTDNWGRVNIRGAGVFDAGPIARNRTKQMNFVDDFSTVVGRHQLKFGGDYRAIFLDIKPYEHVVIFYSFGGVKPLVSTSSGFLQAGTQLPTQFLTQAFSTYAQDTWKLIPRLTLTYGVRWEVSPAPSARGNTTLASWRNINNPAAITLAPPGTTLWNTTYSNFGPRIGVAYSLTQSGDFLIRAGAGIFYDLGIGGAADLASIYPNFVIVGSQVSLPLTNVNGLIPTISLQPPYGVTVGFTPNLKLPRSYQWNLALEKSFGRKQVISATYVGQAGRDLLRQEALFQPNPNFSSEFLLTQNDARSNYNALQLQYRRSLSQRVQALLNYTWSHSLDNASNDVVAGISNTVISAASDYASSDFDVRHSFSGALTYDVPGAGKSGLLALLTKNWSLSSVIVARSGFPFNMILFSTSPDLGGTALSRPDVVAGQPFWIATPSAGGGKSVNPNAFSIPSTIRQGTEGRNDIPGFGLTQVDLSIARKFPFSERVNLSFRADAFNVLNHPNFTNPLSFLEFGPAFLQSPSMLNQGLGGQSPLFQEGGPRSLQLSLKLVF